MKLALSFLPLLFLSSVHSFPIPDESLVERAGPSGSKFVGANEIQDLVSTSASGCSHSNFFWLVKASYPPILSLSILQTSLVPTIMSLFSSHFQPRRSRDCSQSGRSYFHSTPFKRLFLVTSRDLIQFWSRSEWTKTCQVVVWPGQKVLISPTPMWVRPKRWDLWLQSEFNSPFLFFQSGLYSIRRSFWRWKYWFRLWSWVVSLRLLLHVATLHSNDFPSSSSPVTSPTPLLFAIWNSSDSNLFAIHSNSCHFWPKRSRVQKGGRSSRFLLSLRHWRYKTEADLWSRVH